MLDTSGYGFGPRLDWFASFRTLTPSPPQSGAAFPTDPVYGHWFLLRDGQPIACIDPAFSAHYPDQEPIDLTTFDDPTDAARVLMRRCQSVG